MLGTFRPGDRLRIEKLAFNRVRKGDVVVFGGPGKEEDEFVVHRVVGKGMAGPVTRGDNNPKMDEEPVTEEIFAGKVTHYERAGRIHGVWNDRLGMLRARALHGRLQVIKALKLLLRMPYRMVKKTGIVARLWRPEIEMIYFETQDGPLVKYVHKGRTVASCWTDGNRWWFRRPYNFVIGPKLKNK